MPSPQPFPKGTRKLYKPNVEDSTEKEVQIAFNQNSDNSIVLIILFPLMDKPKPKKRGEDGSMAARENAKMRYLDVGKTKVRKLSKM